MFLQWSQWSLVLLMQRLTEGSLFEDECWLLGSILRFCKNSLYAPFFVVAQFMNCFGTSSVSSSSKNLQSLVGLPFFLGISLFGSSVPLQSLLYKSHVSLLCCFSIMKSKFINFYFVWIVWYFLLHSSESSILNLLYVQSFSKLLRSVSYLSNSTRLLFHWILLSFSINWFLRSIDLHFDFRIAKTFSAGKYSGVYIGINT